jgi:hypothetical protein
LGWPWCCSSSARCSSSSGRQSVTTDYADSTDGVTIQWDLRSERRRLVYQESFLCKAQCRGGRWRRWPPGAIAPVRSGWYRPSPGCCWFFILSAHDRPPLHR